MKPIRLILLILSVSIVTLIALGLRLRAVELLPIDYDEDDYLGAAQRYAHALKTGDLQEIIDYDFNFEHPPLTKMLYGVSILRLPEGYQIPERPPSDPPASVLPQPHFPYARLASALMGTLEVLALAILSPFSGLLLAIHTWQIKYTSQIMLEPLPALASLLTVLFYCQGRKFGLFRIKTGVSASESSQTDQRRATFWGALSALALGITAASKYTYAIVGVVILADWFVEFTQHRRDTAGRVSARSWGRVLLTILAWGILAVLIFWAFDPRLWNDPLGRLGESLRYHGNYAQSEQVSRAGFPIWQQLVWLAGPVPWHPGVFLVSLDLYILAFAIVGLPHLWRRKRVFALWLLIAGGFLLVWPTKWPQYLLTLTAPLSLSAAEGFRAVLWEPLSGWLRRLRKPKEKILEQQPALSRYSKGHSWRELRKAWLWLLPGAVALSLIAFYPLIYQAAISVTDFNAISIRDGIQGGVWRAAWQGITGQEEPVSFDPFEGSNATEVHYTGPSLLLTLLVGAIPDLLVFNVLWAVLSVILQTALGVAVALMLHRQGVRWRGFWRTLFILPWAIPEFVGALIWVRLLDPERGWLAAMHNPTINSILSGILSNSNTTLALLLIAATWYGFPFIMLAATAGLKMIPGDVYEAASMDGAGRWGQFRYVTWPLLFPLVMPAILIRSIFAFNQFYLFYIMPVDYPNFTFATLSYYVFAPGRFGGQFAVSAAINMFTVLVLVVLVLWFNRLSRASEGVTYA